MNWFSLKITLLLVLGLFLTEVHSVVYKIWPATGVREFDLWASSAYHEHITLLWYIYELMSLLNHAIWAFTFAMVARYISHKTFKILCVFFGYYITQVVFYVYNRNSSLNSNLIVYIAMAIAIVLVFLPARKTPKLKAV